MINFLSNNIEALALTIIALNSLCALARFHWFFDLFCHFKIQYAACAILVSGVSLLSGHVLLSAVMLCVMVAILNDIQNVYKKPWSLKKPDLQPNFTILQYNKFYFNKCYGLIGRWLYSTQRDADLFLVNESLGNDIVRLQKFRDIFPNQFPGSEAERFNDISILCKHPFSVTPIVMDIAGKMLNASRIVIDKNGVGKIIVYAYHAPVPAGHTYSKRRNDALKLLAGRVRDDDAENIFLAGDWNLTPYSPHFKEILEISGLQYQDYGLLPQTTWPSFNFLPFLKIPIDHVLYSRSIQPVDLKRGPALGSDHQALIARFHVNPAE